MDNKLIVKMKFGSHLYGTDTPESDTDYKGIFLPTKEQILLGEIPKQMSFNTKKDNEEKNTKDDIDIEIYSLHYFINLACVGETVAIDMLHAPDDMLIETSSIWKDIQNYKTKFYSKNIKSFVGYARKQAAKYGIKGSRLAALQKVIYVLESSLVTYNLFEARLRDIRLRDIWNRLPTGEHINTEIGKDNIRMYQVCGKKFPDTCKAEYALSILKKFYDQYGHRAILAQQNKCVDWKSMSHAVRAAYQMIELLQINTIVFPLGIKNTLKSIKLGQLPYRQVAGILENYMDIIEILIEESTFPEEVNREFWDKWLVDTLMDEVF